MKPMHSASRRCTAVRSTVLLSSMRQLRAAGHAERYARELPTEVHEELLALTGTAWVPVELAQAHYEACDRLHLARLEIAAMGARIAPVHAAGVRVVLRIAQAGGVTPWDLLKHAPRYWPRMYQGGEVLTAVDGSRRGLITITAPPLVNIAYVRAGIGGVLNALARELSAGGFVRELPQEAPETVTFAASW